MKQMKLLEMGGTYDTSCAPDMYLQLLTFNTITAIITTVLTLGCIVQNGSYIALIPQLLDFGSNGLGIFASTKVLVECLAKNGVSEGVAKDHPAHVDQTSSVVDDWLDLAGCIHQYRAEKFRRSFGTMGRLGRVKIERCGLLLCFGWG